MARFCVTHPFHPLSGRELELIERERRSSGELVLYRDERGQLRKLPAAWTSVGEVDAWVSVAAGRSRLRPDDLLALAELLDGIAATKSTQGTGNL